MNNIKTLDVEMLDDESSPIMIHTNNIKDSDKLIDEIEKKNMAFPLDEAIRLRKEGKSFREIGKIIGYSHERVRQMIPRQIRDEGSLVTYNKRKAEKDAAILKAVEERINANVKCAVCGNLVLRRLADSTKNSTCSEECAKAWILIRYWVDQEFFRRHQIAVAQNKINNPDKHTPAQIEWAKKFIAQGGPENIYSRKPRKGSKSYELLQKYRPDIVEQLEQNYKPRSMRKNTQPAKIAEILLSGGKTTGQLSAITGYNDNTIQSIISARRDTIFSSKKEDGVTVYRLTEEGKQQIENLLNS